MGKIVSDYSDKIYLTDDNPRFENPEKIRKDVKKGIKKQKLFEISDRSIAISKAIQNLDSGEILLVAGKGHEKIQDLGKKKFISLTKRLFLIQLKKNQKLSNNLKLNILKEKSGNQRLPLIPSFKHVRINSKEVKKNDVFFAIRGKNKDGNKFVNQAFKNGASIAVVNKIQQKFETNRQIKVNNTLKFLTDISKIFRKKY